MGDPAILAFLLFIVSAICYFDFRWFVIPDWLNLLLFGAGVLVRTFTGWQDAAISILVAVGASATIWIIRELHKRRTGRTGLGLGDVKLAGASAVWFSPWNLPLYLFFASVSALVYFALRHGFNRLDAKTIRVPFGPFLGAALIATWGLERMDYLNLAPL